MATTLITRTNADADFYVLLGPFLANREVHKALGGVPWDDDDKTWIIALDDDKRVVGFAAVARRGKKATVESLYTTVRDARLAARLVKAALKAAGTDVEVRAVVRHEAAPAYRKAGFTTTVKETANFVTLVRPVQKKENTKTRA